MYMLRALHLSLVLAVAAACSDEASTPDAGLAVDAASAVDATSAVDAAARADASTTPDAGDSRDAAAAPDVVTPDAAAPDAATPDAQVMDAGAPAPTFAQVRATVLAGCFCHSGQPGFEADEDTAYASLLARTAAAGPCASRGFVVRDDQPNAAGRSHLYQKLSGVDICAGDRMPAAGSLAPGALELLAAWIEAGAPR